MSWEILTASSTLGLMILTLFILIVARGQLKASNAIATADFALKFKHDYFTKESRELLMLLDYDLLQFEVDENDFAYFKVKEKIPDKAMVCYDFLCDKGKNKYSSYEMDDFVISHFEDLGMFEEKGILDMDYVYEGFSYYIISAFENEAIRSYLNWLIDKFGYGLYNKFECIYHKVKIEEHKIESKKCEKEKI